MSKEELKHPVESFLREDRIPHIWCPGCGIGIAMHAFIRAIIKCNVEPNLISVVSGIGCTGRVAGYLKMDSFHTTHGRAIPFATGLKLANHKLKVVVFSGEGDLIAIGGNHFIHAARRNVDITVICINNFNYGMTGGQCGPTTPVPARTSTTLYGNYEQPFNLAYLAAGSGAVFVSRWTVFHIKQMEAAMLAAINMGGFSFVEIISPCPTLYGKMNRQGTGLDMLKYDKENSEINHNADPSEVQIDFNGKIVVGNFVNKARPTFSELVQANIETQAYPHKGKRKLLKEVSKKIQSDGHWTNGES